MDRACRKVSRGSQRALKFRASRVKAASPTSSQFHATRQSMLPAQEAEGAAQHVPAEVGALAGGDRHSPTQEEAPVRLAVNPRRTRSA